MELHGVLIGTALLALVIACGFLLGAKAHGSVRAFSDEKHRRFVGRHPS